MPELLDEPPESQLVRLGLAELAPALVPRRALSALTRLLIRRIERDPAGLGYRGVAGRIELRRRVGAMMLDRGADVTADEILITNGGQEALWLALSTVSRPGDCLVAEAPCYPGVLAAAKALGLRIAEIPSSRAGGIDPAQLLRAVQRHRPAAIYLMPNVANPTGSVYPEEVKRAVWSVVESTAVPLIEDDSARDLEFEGRSLRAIKAFDQSGLVLFLGSVSKSVAPSLRVGWLAPGRFAARVKELKAAVSLGTSDLGQLVLAEFHQRGQYRRHLVRARAELAGTARSMVDLVRNTFPEPVEVQVPSGGAFVWVGLPEGLDAGAVRLRALREGISLLPGSIFSPSGRFRSYLRIGSGGRWDPAIAAATREVGRLARLLARRNGSNR
jgi:DNA-binding transcriptional MocR family regulator